MGKAKFTQDQEDTIQEIMDSLEDGAADIYAEIKRLKLTNVFKRIPKVLDLTKALVARAEVAKRGIAGATGQLVKEALLRLAAAYRVPAVVMVLVSGLIDLAVDELNRLIGKVWPDPQSMADFYTARAARS
jgi:hypothetical protein